MPYHYHVSHHFHWLDSLAIKCCTGKLHGMSEGFRPFIKHCSQLGDSLTGECLGGKLRPPLAQRHKILTLHNSIHSPNPSLVLGSDKSVSTGGTACTRAVGALVLGSDMACAYLRTWMAPRVSLPWCYLVTMHVDPLGTCMASRVSLVLGMISHVDPSGHVWVHWCVCTGAR